MMYTPYDILCVLYDELGYRQASERQHRVQAVTLDACRAI